MPTRNFFCLVIALMMQAASFAQDTMAVKKNKPAIRFQSINQLGILQGQRPDPAILLQSINGIQLNEFFLGLGVGIDYYEHRTIPLFADVRRSVPFFNKSTFVYLDIGANLPWDKSEKSTWLIERYKKGLYYDAGIAYQIKVSKNNAFLISAGYAKKDITIRRTTFYMQGGEIIYSSPSDYLYEFRRVVLKLGWRF